VNRLKDGYVYVKNPMNSKQISKVLLNPEVVDCIVFWTKNAAPMMNKLDLVDEMGFPYYFQWTITPYAKDVEGNLPEKAKIISSFKALSDKIGRHRVIWRYDPIIINRQLTVEYHSENFANMCQLLKGYTNKCIFSYVDLYAKISKNAKGVIGGEIDVQTMLKLAKNFSDIANSNQISLETCCEQIDLGQFGIRHAACINKETIENIVGTAICSTKQPRQRPFCECMESIDIGAYDCCLHGCIYCYANTSGKTVHNKKNKHDVNSPLLIGNVSLNENIVERAQKTLRNSQISLLLE
jgi:hypothetical protein